MATYCMTPPIQLKRPSSKVSNLQPREFTYSSTAQVGGRSLDGGRFVLEPHVQITNVLDLEIHANSVFHWHLASLANLDIMLYDTTTKSSTSCTGSHLRALRVPLLLDAAA